MPLKTNLKSMAPRRQVYKREITLLSHGFSNPTAWPDGRITVYPWDNAIDQWMIDNLRKTSKQELVFGLLGKCCDLNGGSVDDFVADEINTVLLVSRALSTDGVVAYTSMCPFCGDKRPNTIRVPDALEKVGEKSKDYPGYDEITLPVVQDVVRLRPLLVKDEKIISGRTDEKRRLISDGELRTAMRVVTINGEAPSTLDELILWCRAIHTTDIKCLEEKGREITPHLNTFIPHTCDEPECGRHFKHPLTFDQEFFR
jgi:hypothetical protein